MDIEHKHFILVIKKDNRYLQYYDERWKSYLFLNTKDSIEKFINKSLNMKVEKYELKKDFVHKKFSVSHNEDRKYHHLIFVIKLSGKLPNKEFEINTIKYKWFTMDELENDSRVQEVNSDIVRIVKEII